MRKALTITLLAAGLSMPLVAHAQPAAAPQEKPSATDMIIAGGVVGGVIGNIYDSGFAATANSIGSGISSGVASLLTSVGGTVAAITTASPPVMAGVIIGGVAAYLVYRQTQ
jgi:hypothetical protein